jgi:hypothetical protein
MRTPRQLYLETPIVYTCELETCPQCGGPLERAYVSGPKTVQTMMGVLTIAHSPKRCADPVCMEHQTVLKSAQWQHIAPSYCTYGYDVIAQIGWQRQTYLQPFAQIHYVLQSYLQISESQVRYLYHYRYLPLLACHERRHLEGLKAVAEQWGLILSLDGLAPEGGEPQLWVVRELRTTLTLRSGWLSRQDQTAFVNFLQPIRDLGLPVVAVISDKERGLLPAVAEVFPQARHGFCQTHYLKNAAAPVAEADEAMKITLRKGVRDKVGDLIRREKAEAPGVLTVTGLLPSPVEETPGQETPTQQPPDPIAQEREDIVQDLLRRVRYLLTLKGRPPVRLAGIEMFERLGEVETCLDKLINHHADPSLVRLRQGLHTALQSVLADYTDLRQAADWLPHVADLLNPEGKPVRSGAEVRQELFAYLDDIRQEVQGSSRLHDFCQTIYQTSLNYEPGLFHCYDIPGLPRTNNDRESEFRDLNRRLLSTVGQKGLVRRLIQREGAWELIPRPGALRDTVSSLSKVDSGDFQQERQRVCNHRSRFRLHTRSVKQSQSQLKHLEQRWTALPSMNSP